MAEELPKQELLIKLLKMTTAGDGEALVAIRKANALLVTAGWDWEKLIRGKIVVVEDPFNAKAPAFAPKASPAPFSRTAPQAASPQAPFRRAPTSGRTTSPFQPSPPPPDPFLGARVNQTNAQPKPQPAPKQAPVGPATFFNDSGEWVIAYFTNTLKPGDMLDVQKSDKSLNPTCVGQFVRQVASGHFLYKIGKATKWQRKYADTNSVDSLL